MNEVPVPKPTTFLSAELEALTREAHELPEAEAEASTGETHTGRTSHGEDS